ncbi:SDR family oxidoreductase [Lyngbya confervoides]|uniref:SDR family oxidoreductase n=1 Tax=Lyngbya confervoides BDU141951 TaxID=1574623 RepID=A0ABD4T2Z9_9CYAN|nr:SDR family oxidoreductase [Lyngbya confervoides]MCM1983136.1 SDR family oxidoreductase [Lyngbya confervoides BDU141951]
MSTYLVTGANRGIGLEFCRQLQSRGDSVIAVCRQSSRDLDQLGVQVETGLDLTVPSTFTQLQQRLGSQKLDVLINNAGAYGLTTLENFDPEEILTLFQVNALGPLQFTHALLPNLGPGSKIIFITSRMGSIGDNTSGSSYSYRMSKVALSMAGKSLAIDLQPRHIAVAILHPGLVQTRMTGFTSHGISPEQSVKGLIQRTDDLSLDSSGTFWHANGEVLPW